jgi:hypothetical protein
LYSYYYDSGIADVFYQDYASLIQQLIILFCITGIQFTVVNNKLLITFLYLCVLRDLRGKKIIRNSYR